MEKRLTNDDWMDLIVEELESVLGVDWEEATRVAYLPDVQKGLARAWIVGMDYEETVQVVFLHKEPKL